MGKTFALAGNVNIQTANISADSPCSQYLFVSHEPSSTPPVYVRLSASFGSNVAVPTSGTPAYGTPIRPQESIVLSGPQCSTSANVFLSFITSSGSHTITVTPGEGI